jgi:hypothetical protein
MTVNLREGIKEIHKKCSIRNESTCDERIGKIRNRYRVVINTKDIAYLELISLDLVLVPLLHPEYSYEELAIVHVADSKLVALRILLHLIALDALIMVATSYWLLKDKIMGLEAVHVDKSLMLILLQNSHSMCRGVVYDHRDYDEGRADRLLLQKSLENALVWLELWVGLQNHHISLGVFVLDHFSLNDLTIFTIGIIIVVIFRSTTVVGLFEVISFFSH